MSKKIKNYVPYIIIFIIPIIFIILLIVISSYINKKRIIEKISIEDKYIVPYLSQGASSVDSEKQYANSGDQWKGQPNKCYSCEKDMQSRCGDSCVYQASKTKCFDC